MPQMGALFQRYQSVRSQAQPLLHKEALRARAHGAFEAGEFQGCSQVYQGVRARLPPLLHRGGHFRSTFPVAAMG
jgi:hypothetical protein